MKPKITAVLESLAALHDASAALQQGKATIEQQLGTSDLLALLELRAAILEGQHSAAVARLIGIASNGDGRQVLARMAQQAPT